VLGVVQILVRGKVEGREPATEGKEETEVSEVTEEPEEAEEPESIGSLLKCGLGYLVCLDIVGLFAPKLYENWFGEPAFEPVEEMEEYPIERTMIPFGPYLALGAIVATVFQADLRRGVDAYMRWAFPPKGSEIGLLRAVNDNIRTSPDLEQSEWGKGL
jgi:hypothetical protein